MKVDGVGDTTHDVLIMRLMRGRQGGVETNLTRIWVSESVQQRIR